MSVVGADVAALRNFMLALQRRSNEITATITRLSATIEQVPWVGPDRERFLAEWYGTHRPAMVNLCGELEDAARVASRHADAQEEASRFKGATT